MLTSRLIGIALAFTVSFINILDGMAQCICPDACVGCLGGIQEYTLQYNGDQPAEITVRDQTAEVFNGELQPGDIFTVHGSLLDGRFAGLKIYLYIDGEENAAIDVVCTANTLPNEDFGEFVIVDAKRLDGKTICCVGRLKSDNVAPRFISAPDDIIVFTDPGKCTAIVSWDPPVVDDCNLKSLTSDRLSGEAFEKKTTKVTYEAIDDAGNSTKHEFNVTVTDNLQPVISNMPSDTTITTESQSGVAYSWTEPQAEDNCTLKTFSSNISNGSNFRAGTTNVVYTAIDQDDNIFTAAFKVIVIIKEPDEEPPPPEGPVLDVARIITPDGDGKNDHWQIGNIEQYPDNKILVIDRWGSTIFSASNYDNERVAWRGQSQNSGKLPAGTYFYVITYSRQGVPREEKGFIELIP
jgi:gliding motility-associated-like protein